MYLGPPIKVNIMTDNKMNDFIRNILENMPDDWLNLTTHRLDIYDESQAKTEFLKQFEILYNNNDFKNSSIEMRYKNLDESLNLDRINSYLSRDFHYFIKINKTNKYNK